MASLDIGRIREDVEPFSSELMVEFYSNFAGMKDDMATVGIFEKYAHLFSEDAIKVVAEAHAAAEGEDGRWLRYLRSFSTFGYMENAVKATTDRVNTLEAKAVVEAEGASVPYRMVPVILRNESDHDKRRRIFEAKLAVTEELNGMLLDRMTTVHGLSSILGFKNYRDMCTSLKGVDYKALEAEMEEMLKKTERMYVESVGGILEERGRVKFADAWSYDIPFAFRGAEFDAFFDKEKLVESFFKTLRGMKLRPETFKNILIDMEDRPKKSPRAFCAPVKVPDDVRLVIKPTGGWRDYEAFFHEGGHAWHFGCTKRQHPAEYRYLGDKSVTESFAFLFNYLTTNPLWLKEVMGMEDPKGYVKFALANKLMFLRRYAAKLAYELKLHSVNVSAEFKEVYKSCLQRALKFKHTELHYLEDVDDEFYSAEYLRAWTLEGQIRAALEEQFGEDWFRNEKAGDFLKELWSYGQKYTADELVKTIGYVDLDPDPMLNEISRGLTESG
jgi:hypothetical protein